jgi:gas vesicle protein
MATLESGWRTFKVTAKDGGTVESSWANIRLSDDTQVGIGLDITERKRAEADLKKARDNLEETVRERSGQLQATVTALENEMQARSELENHLRQWSRVFMDAADPIVIEDMSGMRHHHRYEPGGGKGIRLVARRADR